MTHFDGLDMGLGRLARLSPARTRSITAENPTGEPGRGGMATEGAAAHAARELGQGWKVSPNIVVEPGETATLAAIEGSGQIQHVWLTCDPVHWRAMLLRFHWDGDPEPAVEVPLGDFFGNGWARYSHVASQPVVVAPYGGCNCYWPMPFRRAARVTIESLCDVPVRLFFQIDYALADLPGDHAYLHAQWRRSNPVAFREPHTMLDGVRGSGHYVGTYLAWGANAPGWWGEGEVKFYLDDDVFPSICGTGTEDYFGGAWDFEVPGAGYTAYTTPYLGLNQILAPDGLYASQQRFGMYRWHVLDPIRFTTGIRATVQALGWRSGGRYLQRQDDIASTALFYLDVTSTTRPATPDADALEVL